MRLLWRDDDGKQLITANRFPPKGLEPPRGVGSQMAFLTAATHWSGGMATLSAKPKPPWLLRHLRRAYGETQP